MVSGLTLEEHLRHMLRDGQTG